MMAVLTHFAAFLAGSIVAAAIACNRVGQGQPKANDLGHLTPEDVARRLGC